MNFASIDSIHVELFDKFQQGGVVMWPMFLMSIAALAAFVERVLFLHRNQIHSRKFLAGIENSLSKGRLVEALTVCQDTPGPAAAMVKAGLMAFRKTDDEIREAVREAAVVELGPIKRRIGVLAAIAHAAPLFGLLGTAIGLIDAFSQYEEQGVYLNAGFLATGMWQALISTATGLALSAVCVLGHHFLVGRVRSMTHEMEWLGQELIVSFVKIKADANLSVQEEKEEDEAVGSESEE
jgi:biopolymer transport protein ExbB